MLPIDNTETPQTNTPQGGPDTSQGGDDFEVSLSNLIGMPIAHVQELISSAPLTGYVGLMDAVKNNDQAKARQIITSFRNDHEEAALGEPEQETYGDMQTENWKSEEDERREKNDTHNKFMRKHDKKPNGDKKSGVKEDMAQNGAPQLDNKQKSDLQRLATMIPKNKTQSTSTRGTVGSAPTNQVTSNPPNTMDSDPGDQIVGVDTNAGTIAVQTKDPTKLQGQQQIELKNIKDPEQLADIQKLMTNAGINLR